MKNICVIAAVFLLFCFSCTKYEEVSIEEFNAMNLEGLAEILTKTVSKPFKSEEFANGRVGGTWYSVMNEDPKSFNQLIAEQDSTTAAVVRSTTDSLLEYDFLAGEWKPRIASARIVVDERNNTMQVIYTLRNDLYWSYYNSDRKVKVTSDDVIFWYNEIQGDPDFQSSGYYG
jgi:peptide/nickel transport system substrate-binding protein